MYSVDFENKLKYARTILLFKYPFFGSLVMSLNIIECGGPGLQGWVDGKNIKINETFALSISREKFTGVLIHLILHIALQHASRGRSRKSKLTWNKVCDMVSNDILYETLKSNSETKIDFPWQLLSLNYEDKNRSCEQLYEKYQQDAESDSGIGYGIESDLLIENNELSAVEEAEINDLVTTAYNNARMQGNVSNALTREVNIMLHPIIDWKILLKEFIQAFPSDWDFSNRDRRFMSSPFYLPSFTGEKVSLALGIDTSGSITKEELDDAMSEAYSIINSFSQITMTAMSCDAEVTNSKIVTNVQDLLDFEVKGGGGTDFRPMFRHIEDNMSDCSALIIFTDGYGDYPESVANNLRVLWIMTTDKIAPIGRTIKYSKQDR